MKATTLSLLLVLSLVSTLLRAQDRFADWGRFTWFAVDTVDEARALTPDHQAIVVHHAAEVEVFDVLGGKSWLRALRHSGGTQDLAIAEMLAKLNEIEFVEMEAGSWSGALLAAIVALPRLHTFIPSSKESIFPVQAMRRLGECKSLRVLRLNHYSDPDPEALEATLGELRHASYLEFLKCGRWALTDKALSSIAACPALLVLDVGYCTGISAEGLRRLKGAKHLKALSIEYAELGKDAGKVLSELTQLEQLTTAGPRSGSLRDVAALPNLRYLAIEDPVTVADAQALAKTAKLEVLKAHSGLDWEVGAFTTVVSIKPLRELDVSVPRKARMHKEVKEAIRATRGITVFRYATRGLDEGGTLEQRFTGNDVAALAANWKLLRELRIVLAEPLTSAALDALLGLESLEVLELGPRDCVTWEHICSLAAAPKISQIIARWLSVPERDLKELQGKHPLVRVEVNVLHDK